MSLPDSGVLAWWFTAWVRGDVGPDDACEALDGIHHVAGLADDLMPMAHAIGVLRNLGAVSAGLAMPVEGDPVGLGGPPVFNADAVDAGEAVVLSGAGLGLVPHRAGHGVVWRCAPAAPRQLPDVGEADRELRRSLARTAYEFDGRNLGHDHPDLADALMNLRHPPLLAAPRGTPGACVSLAQRGLQALGIAELAPLEALRPLAAAGRRALAAACSPECWPPTGDATRPAPER